MSALRVAGALLLTFCGWYAGELHRRAVRAHCDALRRTEQLLQRIRAEIAYRQGELGPLYRVLCAEGLLADAPPQGDFAHLAAPACFSAEERACFVACMRQLGHAQAQQECEQLGYAMQRFAAFRAEARQAAQRASALDRKLGFAVGAMAALALL